MNKIFSMMFIVTMLSMVFVACGDDDEKPIKPDDDVSIESLDQNEADAHFKFDINTTKDSSSIYIYNVKFSEVMPVTVNIRIDAPCISDKMNEVFTFAGTDIIPYIMREGTPIPAPSYIITNLTSTVNTKNKVFNIAFDCHGGHYEKSGQLK